MLFLLLRIQSCNLKKRWSYKHTFGPSVLEELDHLRHVTGLQVLWVVTTTELRIGQEWLNESRGWLPLRPSHRRRVTTKHFPVLHRWLPTGAQFPRPLCVCTAAAPPLMPWNMTLALSVTGWWLAFMLYAPPLAVCLSARSGWRGRNKIESWLVPSWHIFTQNRLIWSWDIVFEDVSA